MKTLKVWTAIWAVVVLVVLVVPCFAQGDRSVTVDPSQQNAGQGSAQTGDQASGGVGGYRPAPTGQDTRKAAPANQATPSAVYAAYNHGKTILRTHTREIRTVVGHTDHQDPYREVKSWNPASRSYVDARDERTLREANAYTDGAIAGSRTESKGGHTPMGASPNDWSGPLPLLLPLLALLLLILVALSWGRIRSWFARLFAGSVVSPVILPDATNRVYGSHHGSQTPTSTVTMYRQPNTYLVVKKAGCNRRMSDTWIWAPAGGRVALTWFPGDEVRFLVQVHNPSRMDVPAGHVILNDAFEVSGSSGMTRHDFRVMGGEVWVDQTKAADIDQATAERIVSGADVSMAEMITALPAGRNTNIVIIVDTTPSGAPSSAGGGGAPTPSGAAAPAAHASLVDLAAVRAKEEAERLEAEVKKAEIEAWAEHTARKAATAAAAKPAPKKRTPAKKPSGAAPRPKRTTAGP